VSSAFNGLQNTTLSIVLVLTLYTYFATKNRLAGACQYTVQA